MTLYKGGRQPLFTAGILCRFQDPTCVAVFFLGLSCLSNPLTQLFAFIDRVPTADGRNAIRTTKWNHGRNHSVCWYFQAESDQKARF